MTQDICWGCAATPIGLSCFFIFLNYCWIPRNLLPGFWFTLRFSWCLTNISPQCNRRIVIAFMFWKFPHLRRNFFLLRFHMSFWILNILRGSLVFQFDSALPRHITYRAIVLDMFPSNFVVTVPFSVGVGVVAGTAITVWAGAAVGRKTPVERVMLST